MINEILESVIEYSSYEDIINELIRIKKDLKNNKIKYENYIDEIIGNEKISIMLEKLINKYCKNITKDNFILDLMVIYRDKNRETDPEVIELMTNKTKENQVKILKKYDKLVYKYANKYSGRGLEIEDLAQEGRMGLLKAYDLYDINRCTKFMTLAVWHVRAYISRAVNNNGRLVRIPVYTQELLSKLNIFKIKFNNDKGRQPTINEIASALEVSEDKVEYLIKLDLPVESLDRPVEDDNVNSNTIANFVPDTKPGPEELIDKKMLREDIDDVFQKIGLLPREKYVLMKRYGFVDGKQCTLDEIGSTFGLTRERIRQIENKALKKVKKSAYKNILESHANGSIAYIPKPKMLGSEKDKLDEGNEETEVEKVKSFYSYYKKYDTTNLENIVNELPAEYKEVIYKKFGKNLNQNNSKWNSIESTLYYRKIRPMIITKLGSKIQEESKGKSKGHNLYNKIDVQKKEVIDEILDGMYPEYVELIHRKYGINYDEKNTLSPEEEQMMGGKILQALIRRRDLLIMGKKLKPMQRRCYDKDSEDDKMDNNNKDVVNQPVPVNKMLRVEKGIQPPPLAVYENGYPNSKEAIKEETKTEVKEETKEEINVDKIDVSKEIVESKKSKENVENNITPFLDIDEIVSTQMFRDFLENTQTIEDIAIMCIICGFLGKKHSLNEISVFLGRTEKELQKGIISILKAYKEYINHMVVQEKVAETNATINLLLEDYTKYVNKSIDSAIEKQSQKILQLN